MSNYPLSFTSKEIRHIYVLVFCDWYQWNNWEIANMGIDFGLDYEL